MKVTFQKAGGGLDQLELPRDEEKVVQVLLELSDHNVGDWDDVILCVRGARYWSALHEIAQFLRAKRKWAELTEDQRRLLEEIEEKFHEEAGSLLEEIL